MAHAPSPKRSRRSVPSESSEAAPSCPPQSSISCAAAAFLPSSKAEFQDLALTGLIASLELAESEETDASTDDEAYPPRSDDSTAESLEARAERKQAAHDNREDVAGYWRSAVHGKLASVSAGLRVLAKNCTRQSLSAKLCQGHTESRHSKRWRRVD